jgi:transcription initiation factor IIF auxiliary subunit
MASGLKLRNRWRYQGGDWWQWEAFLDDGGSGQLQQVDYVEYVLHSTFPNPIRTVDEPEGGFVLKTAGWGTFTLKAFVYLREGEKLKLTHEIELARTPSEGASR